MATEIKLSTWRLCQECGRRIPYSEAYVRYEVRRGGRLLHGWDLCHECDEKDAK